MAIESGRWWASLKSVVTSLDYLNRAMPSESEFIESLRRVGRTGLLEVSSKRFKLTRLGRSALEEVRPSHGGHQISESACRALDVSSFRRRGMSFTKVSGGR